MSVESAASKAYSRRSRIRLAEGSGVDLEPVAVAPRPLDVGGGDTVAIDDGNGLVLTNVSLYLIFWGSYWNNPPTISVSEILEAFQDIVSGPYMSGLVQYRGIQRGSIAGHHIVTTSEPTHGFTKEIVSGEIQELLNNHLIPLPNVESQLLYVVIMPEGVFSDAGTTERGRHTLFFYEDMDHPEDSQTIHFTFQTNIGQLDYLTRSFSHELVESCTDPEGDAFQIVPRDNMHWNEIADDDSSCHEEETRIHGFLVQKYWSQRDRKCIAPASDIIGLVNKVVLDETSEVGPALASHNGRLFLAWRGTDDALNIMFSEDGGQTFTGKHTSSETTDDSPALVSHNGRLYIAWRGSGNRALSVAKVDLIANTAGGFGIEGIVDIRILTERSDFGPSLASHHNRLVLAWTGVGNNHLNLALSEDDGATFNAAFVTDQTSDFSPALTTRLHGRLFLAWTGQDNHDPNVAKVTLFGTTAGHLAIDGLEDQVVLEETSDTATAAASLERLLFLSWKGSGNDNINVVYSINEGSSVSEKHVSQETTDSKPALIAHDGRLIMAWKGSNNKKLSVALLDRFGSP